MANIFLEEETKTRLNKTLIEIQAKEGALITFNGAISRLIDHYEKTSEVTTQ